MEEKERRVIDRQASKLTIESRADGKEYIVGRAVVFGQLSQLLGWFKEQIDPRAFDECDMSDVVAKFNHDENFTLGRTPENLTIDVRADGLYYSIPVDTADPDHIKVRRKIERGDVRGSSFEFTVKPGGADWDTDPESGVEIRTVKKIARLYDVAPVVFPAYLQTDTSVAKRDFESVKEQRDGLKEEQRQSQQEQQNQQEKPVTVTPLSVYERQIQLLKQP